MDAVGKLIRKTLKAKNLSSTELAKNIGLDIRTINNVIQGKSRKIALVNRISGGLGINLLPLLVEEGKGVKLHEINIDADKYNVAFNAVINVIKAEDITCSKEQLDQMVITIYELLVKEPEYISRDLEMFAMGMVHFAIKNFMINCKIVPQENDAPNENH